MVNWVNAYQNVLNTCNIFLARNSKQLKNLQICWKQLQIHFTRYVYIFIYSLCYFYGFFPRFQFLIHFSVSSGLLI